MRNLVCKGYLKDNYPVYLSNDGNFEDLIPLLPSVAKKFVIIDQCVIDYFPDLMSSLRNENTFLFPIIANEDNKTFDKLRDLCKEIFALKPSRNDVVVAIGGGLVMNLAGLTASLIMRGLRFYHVPTTLTGQTDACLGSKQAVNFLGAKNWIGMYNDPEFCYINPYFLRTTTKKEITSQAIEGIKLCLATNSSLFLDIVGVLQNFPSQSLEELTTFIERMIVAKIAIVEKDLMEENYGMSMLYGHTVGHAIEMLDHENISHGEAVGLGMLIAARISFLSGLANKSLVTVHKKILVDLELPTKIPSHILLADIEKMLDYNKKNYSGQTRFVLLKDVGEMAQENGHYYTTVSKDIVLRAIKDSY